MNGAKSRKQRAASGGFVAPLLALTLAAALAFTGWWIITGGADRDAPTEGTVYDTRFVSLKIDLDKSPILRRNATFSVLVGTSAKKAKWVQVNPWTYAGCDEGDGWTGAACVEAAQPTKPLTFHWNGRIVAAAGLVVAMLLVAVIGFPRRNTDDLD